MRIVTRIILLFFISACPTAVFADDTLPTVQFPIGLYSANIPNMKRVSELGFTFVVGGDDTMYIRSARDNGLDVVANTFYRGDTASRQKISRIRNEPNLIANVVVDEPDIYNKPPELVKRLSEEVKVLDPDHPLYITTWIPANYSKYKKYADIFSVTPYPINSTDTFQDLSLVYKSIYIAKITEPKNIPVWATLQAFAGEPTWKRHPRPEELRCMVYQSLIAGAEGILYYSMSSSEPYLMPTGRKNWFLFDDPVTTKTIKELNSEIVDWSSIILDGKRLVPLARVGEAIYTLIQYKENQYLFITNPSTESQTGNIKIPHQAKNPVQRTVLNQGASVQSTSDGVLITLESAGTAVIVIGSLDTF